MLPAIASIRTARCGSTIPTVGGDSVDLPIQVTGDARYYRHNSLAFSGAGLAWVGASGVENCQQITIPLAVKGAPNELQFRVQDGNDDAEEQEDGSIDLTSTDLELVTDKGPQTIGVRFDNVAIPFGTRIERAYIQFTCDEDTSDPTKILIRAEDTDNAEAFSEASKNVSSRRVLEPAVEWSIPNWDKVDRAGEKEQTPDLTSLIQTLVRRPNWTAGNAMSFIITGEGHRVAKSHNGDEAKAATLVVSVDADVDDQTEFVAHTVRLQFAEPEDIEVGQRVFDIVLGDQVVETDFDVIREAGAPRRTIVREYRDVMLHKRADDSLHDKKR